MTTVPSSLDSSMDMADTQFTRLTRSCTVKERGSGADRMGCCLVFEHKGSRFFLDTSLKPTESQILQAVSWATRRSTATLCGC